jgi:hypothetical protein
MLVSAQTTLLVVTVYDSMRISPGPYYSPSVLLHLLLVLSQYHAPFGVVDWATVEVR